MASSTLNILHQTDAFDTIVEPVLICHYHPKLMVHLRVLSWCYTFYGLDKYRMTCIQHYNIIQNSFTALHPLGCAYPSFFPPTHVNHWFCYCLHSFFAFFSECPLVEIIYHVTFSGWLLPLHNIHLRFLCIFPWLDSSF